MLSSKRVEMAKERNAMCPWSWQQPPGLRAGSWDKDRVGVMAKRAGMRDQGLGTAGRRFWFGYS